MMDDKPCRNHNIPQSSPQSAPIWATWAIWGIWVTLTSLSCAPFLISTTGPPGYGMSERWNQYNMMNQSPMWQQHQHQHQAPPQHHQQHSLYSTPSGLPVPQLLSPRLYVGNLVYEASLCCRISLLSSSSSGDLARIERPHEIRW
jgi:hypothetical protein